jgi:hypothetical protein
MTNYQAILRKDELEFQDTDNSNSTVAKIKATAVDEITFESGDTDNSVTLKGFSIEEPTNNSDAATKNYVDNKVSSLASESYVDDKINGLAWKEPVRLATTGNIDLDNPTNSIDVDGFELEDGDRVLLKNQSDSVENGIYIYSFNGVSDLIRADDLDSGSNASSVAVFVKEGTVNKDLAFTHTSDTAVVDNDSNSLLEFTQFSLPLSANSVTTETIVDKAVTADKVADNAIATASILDDAVTADKVADNAIATASILDDAVTADKVADNAIATASILDDAVTGAKIADDITITTTGSITASEITTTSDKRLKTDFAPISGLDIVDKVNPISYRFKNKNKKEYGVIAQELQEIEELKDLVHEDSEGMLSVNYIGMIGVLLQSVKELKEKVTELESKQ